MDTTCQENNLLWVFTRTSQKLLGFIMNVVSYCKNMACVSFKGIAQFLNFQNII